MSTAEGVPWVRRFRAATVRVVEAARTYRGACDANDGLLAVLMQGDENSAALREAEHRSWEAMEDAREALFGALEKLEELEELKRLEEAGS